MDPAVTASLIYSGASALGSGASIIGGSNMNRKNRAWQESMYDKQVANNRADAELAFQRQQQLLQDQRDFELQTSDPTFQMSRLRAAGINPMYASQNLTGQVNSPSVPSVSPATAASPTNFQQINPLAELPGMLQGIAQTVTQMYNSKYSADNIKSQINQREHQNNQIDEAIKNLQSNTVLTDAQVDHIRTQIKDLEYTINEIRPRERRKLDDESKQAAEDLKKTLQEIENTNQIFPIQLETAKRSLEILKDNEYISRNNRIKFDKEYNHLMSNLDKMFRLDDVTLDNALNAAETSNLQTNIQADITREIKEMYDSIDPNEDTWSRVNKFIMGSLILLIQKELSGLPTGYQMYQSARDQRSHDQ